MYLYLFLHPLGLKLRSCVCVLLRPFLTIPRFPTLLLMLAIKDKMREDPEARGNPLCRLNKCYGGELFKYPASVRVSKCSRAHGEEITFPVFIPRKDWAKVFKGPRAPNEDDACAVVRPTRSSALALEAENR